MLISPKPNLNPNVDVGPQDVGGAVMTCHVEGCDSKVTLTLTLTPTPRPSPFPP